MRCGWLYEQAARVSGLQAVTALERADFRVRRHHGSHIIMRRDAPFTQTVVPAYRELVRGTLRAILRHVDLSVEEFVRLLS
jgi:predicted RNA binding protein YcfA (HicA-like mRNA interferase family)